MLKTKIARRWASLLPKYFKLVTPYIRGHEPITVKCTRCGEQFTEFADNLTTARDDNGRLSGCPRCDLPSNLEYQQPASQLPQLAIHDGYYWSGDDPLAAVSRAGRDIIRRTFGQRGFSAYAIGKMIKGAN
jgi:hypothetical protein